MGDAGLSLSGHPLSTPIASFDTIPSGDSAIKLLLRDEPAGFLSLKRENSHYAGGTRFHRTYISISLSSYPQLDVAPVVSLVETRFFLVFRPA